MTSFLQFFTVSMLLFCLFLIVAERYNSKERSRYQYRIQVPHDTYYVNEYREKDGCVFFQRIKVCGDYTIIKQKEE